MSEKRLTYLGPAGTFCEQALRLLPEAADAELIAAMSVPEACDAVRDGVVDAALVPLENSVEGSVGSTLDELINGDPLLITREVLLPVSFVLAARPGTRLEEIHSVASHPHALAQCRSWLAAELPVVSFENTLSTAAAAAAVAGGEFDAAICAPIAAEQQGLAVLASDIGARSDAVTRFVLLSRPGQVPPATGRDLTSLVIYIAHDQAGVLMSVLGELAVRGINLTRIESRPTGEKLGRYCFLLDCDGHVADARLGEALMGLHRICKDVRFLGSYPRAGEEQSLEPAPGTSNNDFAEAHAWLNQLRGSAAE